MHLPPRTRQHTRLRLPAVLSGFLLLVTAACSSSSQSTGSPDSGSASGGANSSGNSLPSDAGSLANKLPGSYEGKTVNAGVVNTFPPDSYSENGSLVGWEVDVTKDALALLGVKVDFVVTSFDSLVPGLQNGKYDLAPATVTITPDRLKVLDIVTIAKTGTGFAWKPGSSISISAPTDVCGHTVATLAGSVFITQLRDIEGQCKQGGKPSLTVQTYEQIPTAVLAVTSGRAEILAISNLRLDYYKTHAEGGLTASNLAYAQIPTGVGFPKNSPLAKPFADAVNKLISDGTYSSILKKWNVSESAVSAAGFNQ